MLFGNPLEFYNGQFSSRAVNARIIAEFHVEWVRDYLANPIISTLWMGITAAVCLGPLVFGMGLLGLILMLRDRRCSVKPYLPSLLVFVPFAFHVYGMVHLDVLVQPLSQYQLGNVRYGLSHILAAALLTPAVAVTWQRRTRLNALLIISLAILLQYGFMLRNGPTGLPVDLDGAQKRRLQKARDMAKVRDFLRAHPPSGQVLMFTAELGEIVPLTGLTFSQIIHEGTAEWHTIREQLPPTVQMVVFREGDWVWWKLQEVKDFNQQFQQIFTTERTPRFQVWVRKPGG